MRKYLFIYLLFLSNIFSNERKNLFEILDTNKIEYISSSIKEISDINIKNVKGETPLTYILKMNDKQYEDKKLEIIKSLIENGANYSDVNRDGESPLIIASRYNFSKIVKLFIEKKGDTAAINSNGNTSLAFVIKNPYTELNNTKTVELVIKNENYLLHLQNLCLDELSICSIFNDFDKAEALIKAGEDINYIDDRTGMNSLMLASIFNSKEVAELLIKNGAKLDIIGSSFGVANKYNTQALHYAVQYNSKDVAELLIKNGANLEAVKEGIQTPLILAAIKNNIEVAELLVKNGANLVAKGENGDTPIHYAAKYNSKDVLELLIKNNVNPEIEGENGTTVLHYAAQYNSKDILEFLIKTGTNPKPILKYIVNNNNLDTIKFLLVEKGMNINFTNNDASELLEICLKNNELELANKLVKQGFNLDNYNFNTDLLRKSIVLRYNDLLKFLMNKGVDPNYKNEKGEFPLLFAAMFDNVEAVRTLLEYGADLNMKNNDLKDVFYVALEENSSNVVKFLIKNGVNVNKKYKNDFTPLHIATTLGSFDVAKVLIENGANIEAKDKYKWTPLMCAVDEDYSESNWYKDFFNTRNKNGKNHEIAMLLIEKGSSLDNVNGVVSASYLINLIGRDGFMNFKLPSQYKIDYSDKNYSKIRGKTALHNAVWFQDIALTKYLVENGADVNAVNKEGDTPLLLAMEKNDLEIIEYLLSQNSKVDGFNKDFGDIFINSSGKREILKLLIKHGFNIDNPKTDINKQFVYAIILNDIEKVKKLINKVTDIKKLTPKEKTSLIFAAENNSIDVLRFLFIRYSNKIEGELKDKYENTVIDYALENNSFESLKYLINSNLNLRFTRNLLTELVFYGNQDLVNSLIHNKLYNVSKNEINYALFSAQTKEMIKLLLENGGNLKFKTEEPFWVIYKLGDSRDSSYQYDATLLEDAVFHDKDISLIEFLLQSYEFNYDEKLKALLLAIGNNEQTALFINNGVKLSDININDLRMDWALNDSPEFKNYFKKYRLKTFDFRNYNYSEISDGGEGSESTYTLPGRALNWLIVYCNREIAELLINDNRFNLQEINEAVFLAYYYYCKDYHTNSNAKEIIKLVETMKPKNEEDLEVDISNIY